MYVRQLVSKEFGLKPLSFDYYSCCQRVRNNIKRDDGFSASALSNRICTSMVMRTRKELTMQTRHTHQREEIPYVYPV